MSDDTTNRETPTETPTETRTPTEAVPPDVAAEVAAVSDGGTTLFVADFSDTDTAWAAYEALSSIEDGRTLAIDGVIVVKRDADGTLEIQKATDHSTRRGTKWGLVGGAVLGVLFPPSIIGSAAVLGAGGAALGKAQQLHHKIELEKELEHAVAPGHSGILALVSDPRVVEIRDALAKANGIVETAVSHVAAKEIRALADEVEQG